ncbi:hypothetical protein P152DRAFT_395864 [Eremomyces bilateralis CBS 781.70]|uniref:Uncharacterized protein n=1 Tax=Eremomyces bilateralis CBS 781.70 TaxID=1392243 RepID=A0A6G1G4I5_9PEZI|nr:uncharacterized protein P152DRAFT_395864 [Eremomyces bilateralis CBS 781.70]KAF1812938.1 hypothetical protein P152DRAFT_395864 [Eremomyces bilateralis CBS 781.70]
MSADDQLRIKFGNPTPLAMIGFLVAPTPFSCVLMGWGGTGGHGEALIWNYFFFGGMLLVMAALARHV